MDWRAIAKKCGEALVRAARAVRSAVVRGARAVLVLPVRAWRSPWRRRVLRPVLVAARVGAVAAALAGIVVLTAKAGVRHVPPTNVAVKQVDWGSGSGVLQQDFGPGFHWSMPGRATWHLLDARTHYLRFGMKSEGAEYAELELRTPDDLEVNVSATVPYRIVPGSAHRIVAEGLKSTYRQGARTAVEKALREAFGELTFEGWSVTDARSVAADAALAAANEALAPMHLEAEAVLVTAAWFPPMFELKIQEQKLNSQEIATDATLAQADEQRHALAVEAASLARAEAELAAEYDYRIEEARLALEVETLAVRQEAQQYDFERRTEAENAYEKAVAEGRLAVARAEAMRERLVNEALETRGGRLMLARDAAENLRFRSITLDANNPSVPSVLDLDAMVALLVGAGSD